MLAITAEMTTVDQVKTDRFGLQPIETEGLTTKKINYSVGAWKLKEDQYENISRLDEERRPSVAGKRATRCILNPIEAGCSSSKKTKTHESQRTATEPATAKREIGREKSNERRKLRDRGRPEDERARILQTIFALRSGKNMYFVLL